MDTIPWRSKLAQRRSILFSHDPQADIYLNILQPGQSRASIFKSRLCSLVICEHPLWLMVNTVVADGLWGSESPDAGRGARLGTAERSDLAVTQPCVCHPRRLAGVPGFTENVKLLAKLWQNQGNLQRMVEISGFPNFLPFNRYFSPPAQWLACEICFYKRKSITSRCLSKDQEAMIPVSMPKCNF